MRFSAVVGHEDLKLALLLTAIDPGIGGVLLRGEKGSGKTTLVRALAGLLPDDAPFVELPLGATEDRVLGSIDIGAALTGEGEQVRSGLLAAAHGGVLFVDEVNLLADHLVDTLLDVAASGMHRLERDGVSVTQPARFTLVGTMNPEEGELRPQLLDRFGLCVDVAAPLDPHIRVEIVRRRLALELDPTSADHFAQEDDQLRQRLATTRPATIDDETIGFAARLAVEVGVEGLRADLVMCRAAAALAAWEGRGDTQTTDIERIAPLALGHRRRRSPFDPPQMAPEELDDALDRARPPEPDPEPSGDETPGDEQQESDQTGSRAPNPSRPVTFGTERPFEIARRRSVSDDRGRLVRTPPWEPGDDRPVSVVGTVRALAQRRTTDPNARVAPTDIRTAEYTRDADVLVVICLDTSGSMGAAERIELATGTALGALTEVYQRRHRVALVTFGGDGAATTLKPTRSVEVARNRLQSLTTGGPTPLAEGIAEATKLIGAARQPDEDAVVVLITDGRTSGGSDAFDQALRACDALVRTGATPVVIDTETGTHRLGLAHQLAQRLGTAVHPVTDATNPTLWSRP